MTRAGLLVVCPGNWRRPPEGPGASRGSIVKVKVPALTASGGSGGVGVADGDAARVRIGVTGRDGMRFAGDGSDARWWMRWERR